MKTLITNQFKNTGLKASGYMGLFGFISDILQPIAPFSGYLFFISAFMVVFILIVMVVKSTLQEKIAPALVISITLFIVSGLFFALQGGTEKDSKDYGVLASQIPAIKTLQSSLGLIQEDVAAIRISTENIDQTTARTEKVVKQVEINTQENTEATKKVAEAVEESTKQIVGSLEEMQKGFTSLTQAGGVIPNPTRPEQFYHNARIQELGGDYGNARQSYNKYFSFKLDFIDPHLRYQSFLKIQEGKAGAREIYSYLYENDPRPIVEYVRILLFDAPERTQMLEDFIKSNPDFASAYYELSREYSKARKGVQSSADKEKEYNALEQFEVLNKEGKLFRYFVDKEIVSNWITDAEERFKLLLLERDSTSTEWYENGQKKQERHYKYDILEGKSIVWYENGQIESEINYKDGKKDGKFTSWYESGNIRTEATYKDGKKDGKWTWWYKSGQKQSERNYKDGELVSETKYTYCAYVTCPIESEINYKDGKKDGKFTAWHENGQIEAEGNYKDGKEHGKFTWWYENGQIEVEGNYKDGKEHGKFTWWYENGQKRTEGNYKDGKYECKNVWCGNEMIILEKLKRCHSMTLSGLHIVSSKNCEK